MIEKRDVTDGSMAERATVYALGKATDAIEGDAGRVLRGMLVLVVYPVLLSMASMIVWRLRSGDDFQKAVQHYTIGAKTDLQKGLGALYRMMTPEQWKQWEDSYYDFRGRYESQG